MNNRNQHGFSLVELMVVIVAAGVIIAIFFGSYMASYRDFLRLQHEGTAFGNVASETQRVAKVIRSAVAITKAENNEVILDAYFSPADAYVSQVRYYISTENGNSKLLADVIPYTANPPIGTLRMDQKKISVIVDPYYNPDNASIFKYFDANGVQYITPTVELSMIKGIQIALSAKGPSGKAITSEVRVSLRNAKTNL